VEVLLDVLDIAWWSECLLVETCVLDVVVAQPNRALPKLLRRVRGQKRLQVYRVAEERLPDIDCWLPVGPVSIGT
jgi:hypothetical protein